MLKTFCLSFSFKNTYRVNSIIYSIKQIPLVKKLLPNSLYQNRGLKTSVNILSAIWEIISMFLGKFLYLYFMVSEIGALYDNVPKERVFLHILFFLTLIGAIMNTYMFNPTNDKYYIMILMRMDAKAYTLSNYIYSILKVFFGFLPFAIFIGLRNSVPLWICFLLPFFIIGTKVITAWLLLYRYEKTGEYTNENLPPKFTWPFAGVFLVIAYGLPYVGVTISIPVIVTFIFLMIGLGIYGFLRIFSFQSYREMYQLLLAGKKDGMDYHTAVKQATENQSRKIISQDSKITSHKKGFEYLNELFIKRHRKILWKSANRLSVISLLLIIGLLFSFQLNKEITTATNHLLMVFLPYFVFVMYSINRGSIFTRFLFMNCDHSMLTYSFYKKPNLILKLFQIRLREIIKINLLPAAVIGGGLSVILFFSGGTDNPLYYVILPLSIIAMSIFFSVHNLTCYYLLQPYNVETEIKSSTYTIVSWVTYAICFVFMRIRVNTLVFGILMISFCFIYCIVACILVYQFAHKTFKIRY